MFAEAKPWLGLVGGPLLFLTNMQASFMLVPWICGHGHPWLIHVLHACTLVLIAAVTLWSWNSAPRTSGGEQFIRVLSMSMGAFSAVALVAHWVPNVLLGACE